MKPIIVSATVGPMPRPMPEGMFDDMPKVTATFDNGETEELFTFYPNEISFHEAEFIGKTKEEAHALHQEKDKRWLQS